MEHDKNTEYVLMYRCEKEKCPVTNWINCKSFKIEKSKCKKCRTSCKPVDEVDVSLFMYKSVLKNMNTYFFIIL